MVISGKTSSAFCWEREKKKSMFWWGLDKNTKLIFFFENFTESKNRNLVEEWFTFSKTKKKKKSVLFYLEDKWYSHWIILLSQSHVSL